MADNTAKIGPIFRGANGGLSDDLFTGIRNSFYYSNDIEIREDAKSAYPKPIPAYDDASKKIELNSTDLKVVNVTYSNEGGGDYSGWIVCTQYKIYLVNETNGASVLCTMNEEIRDLEIFNGYIYVATTNYLYYKIDNGYNRGDMASATDATAINYGRCDYTFEAAGHHPLYGTSNVLCVGDGSKLKKVTKEIYNVVQDGFAVQEDYYIMFIDEMGGYVRVTAINPPYGSEVLLWDKVSKVPDEMIPLEGYHIVQSCIYNGYHYLLSDKGLGLLNGYQYYLLKRTATTVSSSTRNGMAVFNDKLYFVANGGVYIYGAKNKNYPDVLNLWHKVERGTLGAIGANENSIVITRGRIYVSGGTNIPVAVGINEGQATKGEMQTMCYFGSSMSEIKQSMYLRVGYHIPKEGANTGNIHIYYRTEADAATDNPEDWEWHEVTKPAGLYADWDMRSPFATTLKLNCRFQWIQFKFVLENCVYDDNGTTKTKDTNLYSADLYYNDMLD